MPYEIEKRGEKFCVVKAGNGESLGCHDTEKDAEMQRRAILANEQPADEAALRALRDKWNSGG